MNKAQSALADRPPQRPAEAAAALVRLLGTAPIDAADPAAMITELTALEAAKAAIASRQADLAVAVDRAIRAQQQAAGVPAARCGKGVAEQVALARRESPTAGSRLLGLAKALHTELPATKRLLQQGRISEWRATIVAAETACLTAELRVAVDEEIAPQLETMSDRAVRAAARAAAYRLDASAVLTRGRHAQSQRFVSLRPAPDTMTYLTAFLPVREGVACYAALVAAADTARTAGDERTKGQVMADTLVTRLTGLAQADAVPLEIQLVIPDRALLDRAPVDGAHVDGAQLDGAPVEAAAIDPSGEVAAGDIGEDAAFVVGYGPVPAPLARAWVRDSAAAVFVRRLYADPVTGHVSLLESRRRLFPEALRRMIVARDQYCRTPWCGAPIRHTDHVTPHAQGGATSITNGQGLCERCNHAKEAPGWSAVTIPDPGRLGRHVVETTTPTGHRYRSTAPPVARPIADPPNRTPIGEDSAGLPRAG